MPTDPGTKLSDADLDRLARKLFTWAQAQHIGKRSNKSAGDWLSGVDADLLNGLLVASGDAGKSDNDD